MYKFTFGLITGFLAGAAVVLYAAPKKLQKQIKEAVEDQVDNVEKLVKKVVNA
jgi:gas vesicle protein